MSIQNASSYIPIIITSTVLIITLAILAYYSLTSNPSSVLQSDLVYLNNILCYTAFFDFNCLQKKSFIMKGG